LTLICSIQHVKGMNSWLLLETHNLNYHCSNTFQGLLFMLGAATVPSLICFIRLIRQLLRRESKSKLIRASILTALDLLALTGQLSMIIAWTLIAFVSDEYDTHLAWAIPTSAVALSVRWWENFWKKDDADGQEASEAASDDCNSRVKIHLILSIWKIIFTFLLMIVASEIQLNSWSAVFTFDSR
jgi:hypothetical protein